jgi:SPP1 gp7 family putative phage head morphogenesis protein
MAAELRFDLEPRKALEFFRGKGYTTSFGWQEVWQYEHDLAFTVAKMMYVDLLRDVRMAVDKAISEGQTLEQFKDQLKPRLVEAGWWGKAEMTDPQTGEEQLVQLGSPRRLQTIFETNIQTSYAAGHWAQIRMTKADAPYLMYDAVNDARTRPEHAAWDGLVLRADDPWWMTHFPPNDFGCRCGTIQLSADQAAAMGKAEPDQAPPDQMRQYTNPRTGEVSEVPKGVGPGFAYAPGSSRIEMQRDLLAEKEKAFRDGK